MGNRSRIFCVMLGAALMVSALLIFRDNRRESLSARESAEAILRRIEETLQGSDGPVLQSLDPSAPEHLEIDGRAYLGVLRIVPFDLPLPVIAQWSYADLKIAPCRYSGSAETDDLVIMAHNYDSHFGALQNLVPGDLVEFQNAAGEITRYRVELVEILPPTETYAMTAGNYQLTLFTCTYGGENRVTVRCSRLF